jgi:hypothetical protein
MIKKRQIAELLKSYFKSVNITGHDGVYIAEFGGELPAALIHQLKDMGADAYVYHPHRPDESTVVTF